MTEKSLVHFGLSCPLCGSSQLPPAFRGKTKAIAPQSRGYDITVRPRQHIAEVLRCGGCGLVFLPIQRRKEDFPVYYDSPQETYVQEEEWRLANARRIVQQLPRREGRLLDVGCAVGYFLKAAQEAGFHATGVEISRWAARYGQERFGLDIQVGEFEHISFAPETFAVVALIDVLEHLRSPLAVMEKTAALLRPGGQVVILTPDIGSLVARILGRRWWGVCDDHLYYFSRKNLRQLLERCGFSVLWMKAFGRTFTLQHWLYRATGQRIQGRLGRLALPLNLGDQVLCLGVKSDRSSPN